MGILMLAQAIGCLVICAAFGITGLVLAHVKASETGPTIIILAATTMPWMGQEFARRVPYTRGETRSATLNDLVSYRLRLLGVPALVFLRIDHASPETVLAVLGISSLIAALLGLWQLRHYVHFGRETLGAFKRTGN